MKVLNIKNVTVFAVITMAAFCWSSRISAAPVSGAVFTTTNGGTTVNGNIYASKQDVYLGGGPQGNAPCTAAGLPDGDYYFRVTNPNGSLLLSTDSLDERKVRVSGGLITQYLGTTHLVGAGKCSGGISIALFPYNDTDNSGGEYKAWMSQDPKFAHSNSKTDNFKIKATMPEQVIISGAKFYDYNQNQMFDSSEQVIPGWHIELYKDGETTPISETDTDADGGYKFLVDKNSGNYTVKEVLPNSGNWINIGALVSNSLASGVNNTGINFGNIRRARVSGMKFKDSNMDGMKTGEDFIGGIDIMITTVEPNADPMNPAPPETVQTSTVDGSWSSSLHPLGTTYTICENVNSAVYQQTAPTSGCYSVAPAVTTDLDAVVNAGNLDFGNVPVHNIGGTKYKDADMSGGLTGSDSAVTTGVIVNIDNIVYPNGAKPNLQRTTDGSGNWSVAGLPEGTTFRACEVVPTNSMATAAICLTGTVGTADTTNLNFFNIPLAQIGGTKYYDADKSGTLTTGDSAVQGIKITIAATKPNGVSDGETVYTAAGGSWQSKQYPEGTTYSVTETLPNGNWTQTGTTTVWNGKVGSANTGNLDFYNVCTATPGGRTLGFWSNKNGQALLTTGDFTALSNLNLRDANGLDKNFAGSLAANKTAFNSWLLSANATNMSYMLSAQMSATKMSVDHLFSLPNVIVDGTRTVAQEIVYANSLLADAYVAPDLDLKNLTVKASAERTEQGRVKDILDKINNGGSFVQSAPCPFTFPY